MKKLLLLFSILCATLFAGQVFFEQKNDFSIPIQTNKELAFNIPAMTSEHVVMEFDARIDYPPGIGGYNATAMVMFMNKQIMPIECYVNCPMEFRYVNGRTGEPGRWATPRWNFETVKTGDYYTDLFLKMLETLGGHHGVQIDIPSQLFNQKLQAKECVACRFVRHKCVSVVFKWYEERENAA